MTVLHRNPYLGEFASRKVKHLFGQHSQDMHAVFAEGLACPAGTNDIRDEARPFVRPVLFEDLDQDEVELVQVHL